MKNHPELPQKISLEIAGKIVKLILMEFPQKPKNSQENLQRNILRNCRRYSKISSRKNSRNCCILKWISTGISKEDLNYVENNNPNKTCPEQKSNPSSLNRPGLGKLAKTWTLRGRLHTAYRECSYLVSIWRSASFFSFVPIAHHSIVSDWKGNANNHIFT